MMFLYLLILFYKNKKLEFVKSTGMRKKFYFFDTSFVLIMAKKKLISY